MLRQFYACFLFLLVGCMLIPYCVVKATYEGLGSAIDHVLDRLGADP